MTGDVPTMRVEAFDGGGATRVHLGSPEPYTTFAPVLVASALAFLVVVAGAVLVLR